MEYARCSFWTSSFHNGKSGQTKQMEHTKNVTNKKTLWNRITTAKTGLAKVTAQCSADTFVVKIVTFAMPENESSKPN